MSMNQMPVGGGPTAPRPGWWSRNWKWFVPVGCLGMVAVVVAFIAAIVLVVFGAMKSSDAYKGAVAQAKAHPEVIAALGTPIEEGMFVSGKTNVDGSSGEADLTIPISGPKGKAKIYAVATKRAGRWTYSTLKAEIDGRDERINLLGDAAEAVER
jgi:hypothetical protein